MGADDAAQECLVKSFCISFQDLVPWALCLFFILSEELRSHTARLQWFCPETSQPLLLIHGPEPLCSTGEGDFLPQWHKFPRVV